MQRTVTYDDLDGTSIATEQRRFSVDDDFLILDLSPEHADEFDKLLAPYIAAAQTYSPTKVVTKPSMSKEERQAITEWAKTIGVEIAPRGRIAQELQDRFKAAQEAEGHATVEQIEQAMKAGEETVEPTDTPEETAVETTSDQPAPSGRRRTTK